MSSNAVSPAHVSILTLTGDSRSILRGCKFVAFLVGCGCAMLSGFSGETNEKQKLGYEHLITDLLFHVPKFGHELLVAVCRLLAGG